MPLTESVAAASISAITPIGVPLPSTQPQKRGWLLPSWYGCTYSSVLPRRCPRSGCGSAGGGPSKCAFTCAGACSHAGRSRSDSM